MCADCGCFHEKQEFVIADLYNHNYNARLRKSYHKKKPVQGVLKQLQGRESKQSPLGILHQIKFELPIVSEATAIDVKNAMRVWQPIERDRRKSFPNYWNMLFQLPKFMGQTALPQQNYFAQNPLAASSARLHLEEGVRSAGVDLATNGHSLHRPIGKAKTRRLQRKTKTQHRILTSLPVI
jgi:hypothetical protein